LKVSDEKVGIMIT